MGFWKEVAYRAWHESAKAVKLDSKRLIMVLILNQIIIGFVLFFAFGVENLLQNIWTRLATFAAPFLLFVLFFIWEFILTPPKMHAAQVAALHHAVAEKDEALRAANVVSLPRDTAILNLQEENEGLKSQMSALKLGTDADYPFDTRQRAALVTFLAKVPTEARFVVAVRHSGFSGNSDFARRMARAFREAGWDAQVTPDPMMQSDNEGIHLASCRASTGKLDPLSASGELLRDALDAAEIKFSYRGYTWPDDLEKPSSLFFVFPPSI